MAGKEWVSPDGLTELHACAGTSSAGRAISVSPELAAEDLCTSRAPDAAAAMQRHADAGRTPPVCSLQSGCQGCAPRCVAAFRERLCLALLQKFQDGVAVMLSLGAVA